MAGVQPSKFINYISQWKKLLVTRNNGVISQKFKIDSNITDDYYFSIVNSNNQLVSLEGRQFKLYGSIIDAKDVMHILFYSQNADIEPNNTVMHFNVNTYTSQYMAQIKNNRIIDLTIVEVIEPAQGEQGEDITQVVLRDEAIAYKRAYIENQVPAEILERVILTTNVPLTGVFGSGQDLNLTIGSNGSAFGTGLTQTGDNQLVIGQYNEVDNTKVFVIGNGDNDTERSNILTVDYEGNISTSGALSANAVFINGEDISSIIGREYSAGYGIAISDQDVISLTASIPTVPTNVGAFTNDVGYITVSQVPGYTGQSGVVVDNTNRIIKLSGQLGKTYTADDVTLQLSNNNQFSIKSIASKLNQGANIILTPETDGSVTINAVGGGGGGTGGATYLAGLGLSLSTVSIEDAIYKFYVNESWLDNKIDSATSGIQNLSAGTGLAIEDNVISLTATIPSIDGLASEQWVEANFLSAIPSTYATKDYVDSSVSGKADLSSVYTKEEVYTYIETDVKINQATSGKADKTELTGFATKDELSAVDAKFANYDTSTEVDDKITAAIAEIPTTVYTGTDGIKVEDGVISLTATLSSITNDAGFITENALIGLATESDLQIVSGVVDQNTLDIGDLNNAIGSKANQTDLEALSGEVQTKAETSALNDYVLISTMSAYATSAWVDENYLAIGDVPTDVYTKTEVNQLVDTASGLAVNVATGYVDETLTSYYDKTEVDTISGNLHNEITGAVNGLATEQWVEQNFLSASQIDNYYTKTEVDNAIKDFITEDDLSGLDNRLTAIEADYTTSAYVTGQVNDLATGAVATNTTNIGIISSDLQTANENISTISGNVDDLSTTVGTFNDRIDTISGKVDIISSDYVTSAQASGIASAVTQNYIIVSSLATMDDIPSAVSQLINDVGFITYGGGGGGGTTYTAGDYISISNQNVISVTGLTTSANVSAIVEGYGYQTSTDVTNAISNASGDIVNAATAAITVPTKISDLQNDSEFATSANVSSIVEGYGYQTSSDVANAIINASGDIVTSARTGMATTSDISDMATKTWVGEQGFATTSQIPSDYTTSAQVSSIVEGYGYITGYTAGEGIDIQDGVISATGGGGGGATLTSVFNLLSAGPNIQLSKDDSTGITTISGTEAGSPITNKQAKLTIAGDTVQYNPDYEIFETTQNAVVDGVITIKPVTNVNLADGEVATFEQWITPSAVITGFAFDSSYKLVGELPSSFTAMNIQVFTVRIYKSSLGVKYFISYAYEFNNPFYTPLTFKGLSSTNAIALKQTGSPSAITLQYSKNGGQWTTYTVGDVITLDQNDTVAFSGANDHFSNDTSHFYQFQMTGTIEAGGNNMSLMNYSTVIPMNSYYRLFNDCTGLTKAPQLPATTANKACFQQMFRNCTSLQTPPSILPATTTVNQCYQQMFNNCTSLLTAPQLPATGLTVNCYSYMFAGCASLTKAPLLPATNLPYGCYGGMFNGCTNLSSINVSFTAWNTNSTTNWVDGVAANGTFTCPTALGTNQTITRGNTNCPTNWTVVNK